jgi:intein/homing endonuclease
MSIYDTNFLVKKRNGSLVSFEKGKIKDAIYKCLLSCDDVKTYNLEDLTNNVCKAVSQYILLSKTNDTENKDFVDVELIQDIVENILVGANLPQAAKSYILYRNKRSELRNQRLPGLPKEVIADFIHVAKYSQYKKEVFRREVHGESIDRVQNMHIEKFPQIENDIRWAFNKVRDRVSLPSMRSMQFGGKGVKAINERIYNCSFSPCNRFSFFKEAFFLLLCGCGTGFSVQKHHVAQLAPLKHINKDKVRHHIVEDTIQGWADALHALIMSYVEGDYYTEFSYSQIRGKGSYLSTSGGRAPGHIPLKLAIRRIRKVLDSVQGRHLRPIECHDIVCLASEAVLAGGVRRSASISLFSIDDEEMINAKTGEWWKTHPWRSRANNSAVLLRSQATFEQYSRLFRSTKEYGEPGFLFVDSLDYGTNPCFHPDTRISTSKGWMKIGDMEKNGIPLCVNTDTRVGKGDLIFPELKGNKLRKATSAFLTKKSAEVFEIQTEHGQRLKVTENHKFPTFNGRKETHELSVGDTLLLNSGSVRFGREGSWDQGFILGMLTGDGCFSGKSAFIDIWESDFELSDLLHKIVNDQRQLFKLNNKNDLGWHSQDHGTKKRIGGANFYKVVENILQGQSTSDLKKMVPEVVWKGTKEMVAGYIAGMIVSDGTVLCSGKDKKKTVSLRISQVNRDLLEDIQNLLMGFGIVSKVYRRTEEAYRKLPDGKGGHKDYLCQPMHELIISRPNCITFENTIKLPGAKGRRLTQVLDERGRDCNKPERHITKIVSITKMDERTDVYCLTQPETNSVIANGIVSGNCSEVQFNPFYVVDSKAQIFLKERNINVNIGDILCGWSFCNLSEVNVAACKTEEEFLESVTAATIIGTCQAGYTDFPYLGPVTELLARRDALLGVSMTGMVDNPAIAFNADLQRRAALLCKEVNEKFSALLGINSAARLTAVKPSGTASLALGCVGSGIHPHHAKRYFRRVRMSPGEAVYQFFKSINPHMCEKVNDTEDVITFCVEAPEGAVTRNDMTALEFLERVFLTQTNWIAYGTARDTDNPGLKNNVSNTVVVKPDEWEDVKHFLWDRRFQFSGISMLPYSGDKDYAFAPREEVVTEKDEFLWNNIVSNFKPVNYEFMLELEDGTSFQGEAACSAGGCEQ